METISKAIAIVAIAIALLAESSRTQAAPGDLLTTVPVPVASSSCCGIGVAYDGTNILYTNYPDPTIYKTDLAGNNNGSLPITGASDCCNAIAYDASTGKLWGGSWNQCDIYEVDLITGAATLKHDNLTPCPIGFVDGLAWDPVNDTLWWSDDVNCTITEINKSTGATIQSLNFFSLIGKPACSDGYAVSGGSSGLAIGLDHTLFMGSNGDGVIYSADANPVPPSPLGSFANVGGRDEDMECGPRFKKSDGSEVETLLSKDAYDNTFDVLEMKEGQCVSPAKPKCGDGNLNLGEECDDGNTTDGDGCSHDCKIENQPPDCSGASPSTNELWPPNHQTVPVTINGVTDPDGDPITIIVSSISQDEPLNTVGDGNTCPDAAGLGSSTADLRAERSGTPKVPGDGRVYHVKFIAQDDEGASCSGQVTVCVPHDQRPGHVCVDQGPLFDSTVCP